MMSLMIQHVRTDAISLRTVGLVLTLEVNVTLAPSVGVMMMESTSAFNEITLMWLLGIAIVTSANSSHYGLY